MMLRYISEVQANKGQVVSAEGRGGTLTGNAELDPAGETMMVEVAFKSRVAPTFTEWFDALDVRVI